MKNHNWPIIAGIVGGAISRGPCFGSISGAILGVIVGIPLYYLLLFIVKKIKGKKQRFYRFAAIFIIASTMIVGQWFLFHPPAPSLFRSKIARPIPKSVGNIKAKSFSIGPDYAHYMKFNIGQSDLNEILIENNFQKTPFVFSETDNNHVLDISPPNHCILSMPYKIDWFRLDDMQQCEVYVIDNLDSHGAYEYIIYDPNTQEALYEFFKI